MTHLNRAMARPRCTKKHRKRKGSSRGGGWSEGPNAVSPGYLIHNQYTGPGKDCTGNAASLRPEFIPYYPTAGLPGSGPGWSRGGRRRRGGALNIASQANYGSTGPVPNPMMPPVSSSLTPKPDWMPNPTGSGGSVGNPNPAGLPVVASWPGAPVPGGNATMPIAAMNPQETNVSNLKQSGGRYGFFPQMGPLNPYNGVGTTPAPFGRIPCERGSFDALNANPGNIQGLSTAPAQPPYVTGSMRGGMAPVAPVPGGGFSAANFPTVQVGDADSMRYYAPTAGYRNDFMTFRAPSAVPGLTIQTPYDARAFNQACIKTGGSRKKRRGKKRGGNEPVAKDAGQFSNVTIGEVDSRYDFDFSNKGLPVKFGGRRTKKQYRKRTCKK